MSSLPGPECGPGGMTGFICLAHVSHRETLAGSAPGGSHSLGGEGGTTSGKLHTRLPCCPHLLGSCHFAWLGQPIFLHPLPFPDAPARGKLTIQRFPSFASGSRSQCQVPFCLLKTNCLQSRTKPETWSGKRCRSPAYGEPLRTGGGT